MVTKGEQCQQHRVCGGRGFWTTQCSKKAIVERDGKKYCKIHDPVYIKVRNDASYAKYQSECMARNLITRTKDIAYEACKEINHEHPELVAQNIKDMYEIIKYLKENCYDYIGVISAARIDSVLSKIKGGK